MDERLADEARARAALPRADRWSRFIARFPYVRGVAVSGTLSKGVMKEGDDLDYLVFTEPDRVWFCRLLLMGFKKVFLFNSHHRFCVNYLLAEDHLEIPDRDLFTATEIAWLLPMVNPIDLSTVPRRQLMGRGVLSPTGVGAQRDGVAPSAGRSSKTAGRDLCRWLLGGRRLDDWSHRLISRRNKRRYGHLEIRHEVALRSEKHASKHHPRAFQERVLRRLADEIEAFEAAPRGGDRGREAAGAMKVLFSHSYFLRLDRKQWEGSDPLSAVGDPLRHGVSARARARGRAARHHVRRPGPRPWMARSKATTPRSSSSTTTASTI